MQKASNDMGLKFREPARKPMFTQKWRLAAFYGISSTPTGPSMRWKKSHLLGWANFKWFGPNGTLWVKLKNGRRYSVGKTLSNIKHSPYVMIWGCIKSVGLGLIIFLRSSMSAIKYIDIINATLVPKAEELLGDYDDDIFQDHSALRGQRCKNFPQSVQI